MNKVYYMLGLMSGSSLDGLDIAYCRFKKKANCWEFDILEAETYSYPNEIKQQLKVIPTLSAEEFVRLDKHLGELMGSYINQFLKSQSNSRIDFIASHGHTAFHNPEERYTSQIGSGAIIAAQTQISTIADFRMLDVALGGQGAPLVPVGDRLLFGDYDYCLNLGGYSNISFEKEGKRIAFDICPVNKALNILANQEGKEMDHNGQLSRSGNVIEPLLEELNQINFYSDEPPKSLGDQWLKNAFLSILDKYEKSSISDQLRTVSEHIAMQIQKNTNQTRNKKILTTGGGAHNTFLMERIASLNKNEIVIPKKELVDYKEALIFAFMGVLRVENQTNCLSSVTGAAFDNKGGIIYQV